MTYTLEVKQNYALRIIKELEKADAVKLRKITDSRSVTKSKEDVATLKLMAEADFSETVSGDVIFEKLRKK